MRYAELGHYVRTLERSGSDANKLKVERALKLAIPVTCLIIVLFGAPLGMHNARLAAPPTASPSASPRRSSSSP